MSDQLLTELLEDSGRRVHVGPAPAAEILAEVARRRRLRAVTRIITAGGVAAAVTIAITLVGNPEHSADKPIAPAPGRPLVSTVKPTQEVSRPPRPPRVTMRTVRRVAGAQQFRPYTGPWPPGISEAAALQRGNAPDNYSLGLWDVGLLVHADSTVEWHSVWIIAAVTFVPDLNQLSLGGPFLPPGATTTPQEPRPGWGRSVTMLDARTGKLVIGLSF